MIRINLKKSESDFQPKGRKILGVKLPGFNFSGPNFDLSLGLVLVTALGIAGLPYLVVSQYCQVVREQHESANQKVEASIKALNQEIQLFIPFQKELESYEQQKTLVKTRLGVVEGLLANRSGSVHILNAFGQSLPSAAWVSQVDLKFSGKEPGLQLGGLALSNEDISDFLDKLGESIYFTDVQLQEVTSGKSPDGKIDVKNFKVATKIKGADANEPKVAIPPVAENKVIPK